MSGSGVPLERYRRSDATWRTLGDEILVLGADVSGHVMVLGGGSALVWRHLDDWASPARLRSKVGGDATEADVVEALELLVSAGLAEREEQP